MTRQDLVRVPNMLCCSHRAGSVLSADQRSAVENSFDFSVSLYVEKHEVTNSDESQFGPRLLRCEMFEADSANDIFVSSALRGEFKEIDSPRRTRNTRRRRVQTTTSASRWCEPAE
jgi:hypothetical protein